MLFRESVTSTSALKDPGTNLVTTSDRMALFTYTSGRLHWRKTLFYAGATADSDHGFFLFRLVMNYCGITSHSVVSCLRNDC